MLSSRAALSFPAHFPPTTRWKKFFIGVRWFGPDLSFFKDLREQQSERAAGDMCVWGDGFRLHLAERLSRIFGRGLRWPNDIFLPQDSLAVISYGPRFAAIDALVFQDALRTLKSDYGINLSSDYWVGKDQMTFGSFIDDLVAIKQRGR